MSRVGLQRYLSILSNRYPWKWIAWILRTLSNWLPILQILCLPKSIADESLGMRGLPRISYVPYSDIASLAIVPISMTTNVAGIFKQVHSVKQ